MVLQAHGKRIQSDVLTLSGSRLSWPVKYFDMSKGKTLQPGPEQNNKNSIHTNKSKITIQSLGIGTHAAGYLTRENLIKSTWHLSGALFAVKPWETDDRFCCHSCQTLPETMWLESSWNKYTFCRFLATMLDGKFLSSHIVTISKSSVLLCWFFVIRNQAKNCLEHICLENCFWWCQR